MIQRPANLLEAPVPADAMERKQRKKGTQRKAGETNSRLRYGRRQVSRPSLAAGGGYGGGSEPFTWRGAPLLLHISLLTAAWPLSGLLGKNPFSVPVSALFGHRATLS